MLGEIPFEGCPVSYLLTSSPFFSLSLSMLLSFYLVSTPDFYEISE